MTEIDLQKYLNEGVKDVLGEIAAAGIKNPGLGLFLSKFVLAAKKAEKIRQQWESQGVHIPPFLIASITGECNLSCKGCYASAVGFDRKETTMSADDWARIFTEAKKLGITFILLAGGEPLLRLDVIEKAAKNKSILFPVFTNGTLLESHMKLFFDHRNLIPVISLEGDAARTDNRRGAGIYESLEKAMAQLSKKNIFFGASVTITEENIASVTNDDFLDALQDKGCRLIFYVEYVPMDEDTKKLALTEKSRSHLEKRLEEIRSKTRSIMLVSFPGDEKLSGGCLAAGRGFFHINPWGGAEPCPFSPYSDVNVKDSSLLGALESNLFKKLKDEGLLTQEHTGGCVLFEQENQVRELLD